MEGIAVALICICLFLTAALTLRVSQQPSQWWCLCLVEPGRQGTKVCTEPCVLSWSNVWMCWFVVPTTHSTHRLVYKLQDNFFSDTVCTVFLYAKRLPIIYWHMDIYICYHDNSALLPLVPKLVLWNANLAFVFQKWACFRSRISITVITDKVKTGF